MAPVKRPCGENRSMRWHTPQAADPSQSSAASPVPSFGSLLSPGSAVQTGDRTVADPVLADLRLDQVIEAAAAKAAEREMVASLLSQPVSDAGILTYRQKVFHDLEDAALFEAAKAFASRMREVRAHLVQPAGMRSAQQRQGRFLDAAAIYCDAVQNLTAERQDDVRPDLRPAAPPGQPRL